MKILIRQENHSHYIGYKTELFLNDTFLGWSTGRSVQESIDSLKRTCKQEIDKYFGDDVEEYNITFLENRV